MSLTVDIQKRLGNFQLNTSFSIEGGVTGLLGASGCGKSITLKCIWGIETPDAGHIELDGRVLFDSERRINLPPQQRHVGYLFQHYALFPNMTVEQNIASGVRNRSRRREETARLMATFQLEDCRGQYPRQLSGGQQQRVALARILASEPEALLLDEPFSALDSTLKRRVELELMDRLEEFPGPVVFVTHDRGEIRRMCQNVCVLDRGSSQPLQTVERLFVHPITLSACRLSGCENISAARLRENGTLEAPEWGVCLTPPQELPEGVAHVGIRANRIRLAQGPGENRFQFRVLRKVEDLTGVSLVLTLPEGQGGLLHMALERGEWENLGQPERVWAELPPEALLPLVEYT